MNIKRKLVYPVASLIAAVLVLLCFAQELDVIARWQKIHNYIRVKLFVLNNRGACETAMLRAGSWLNRLSIDPQELRVHGIKGKKKLTEAASAYYRLYRCADIVQKPRIFKKVKKLVSITYENSYHNMGSIDDESFKQDATSYLRLCYLMGLFGLDTAYYKKQIEAVLPRINAHLPQRGYHQRQMIEHYYRALGFVYPLEYAADKAASVIANELDPYAMSTLDAYALTHEIFAAYDFGYDVGAASFSQQEKAYLKRVLPVLTMKYLFVNNIDLAAELVSCMKYMGVTACTEYLTALECLLRCQNPDGSYGCYPEQEKLYGKDLARYQMYLHTTTVVIYALTDAFDLLR